MGAHVTLLKPIRILHSGIGRSVRVLAFDAAPRHKVDPGQEEEDAWATFVVTGVYLHPDDAPPDPPGPLHYHKYTGQISLPWATISGIASETP